MEKKISEADLIKAVKYAVAKQILEADDLGVGSNAEPAKEGQIKYITKTLNADSLFDTGKDEPNTNSDGFKNAVKGIVDSIMNKNIKKPVKIDVQGGASAVGQKSGYDNKGLADRRRDKTLIALTQEVSRQLTTNKFGTTSGLGYDESSWFKFNRLPSVVGKAEIKDSPEAKKEQFVKVTYPISRLSATDSTAAIDRTATAPVKPGNKEKYSPTDVTSKMKPVFITDKKTKYTFPEKGFNEINSVLNKYGLYLPADSKIVSKRPSVS